MKHLISHLIKNNLEEIVNKSLLHCHCKGLHSIMLLESPGKTIRLFISTPQSEMYKNLPETFNYEKATGESLFHSKKMSIAFHPHHCNVTLHVINGCIFNWTPIISKNNLRVGIPKISIQKFRYHSKITKGETAFEFIGDSLISYGKIHRIETGTSVHMPSNQCHTVGVGKGTLAAWLVYEGKEDPNYEPYCWSNHDLRKQNFSELYKKPTRKQVLDLLTSIGLL